MPKKHVNDPKNARDGGNTSTNNTPVSKSTNKNRKQNIKIIFEVDGCNTYISIYN